MVLKSGIAGCLLAFQHTHTAKHQWCRTDGRHIPAGCSLCHYGTAHALVVAQVGRAGHTAGQYEQRGLVPVGHFLYQHVGHYPHAVGTCHRALAGYTYGFHVYPCPSQDINGSQRLDLLEASG